MKIQYSTDRAHYLFNNYLRHEVLICCKAEANQSNISSNTLDEKLDECRMNVG